MTQKIQRTKIGNNRYLVWRKLSRKEVLIMRIEDAYKEAKATAKKNGWTLINVKPKQERPAPIVYPPDDMLRPRYYHSPLMG